MTRNYQGPVIVAGDFNTWSDKRRLLLQNALARYQFQEASYQPDERTRVAGLPLDHLFYRGLTLSQGEAVSSDGLITILCDSAFTTPESFHKKRLQPEAFSFVFTHVESNYRLWVNVRVMTSRCCSGVRALKRTA